MSRSLLKATNSASALAAVVVAACLGTVLPATAQVKVGARALMAKPRLLLLDEPSLGLAAR
jgi:ABC-type molybdenum transport system ATPase subunit/photorepair protein PhrA